MNAQNAKEYLPLITALAEGKTIQAELPLPYGWSDCDGEIGFTRPARFYRIKLSPKLRPWKAEEVPVGCLVRNKSTPTIWYQIVSKINDVFLVASEERIYPYEITIAHEHSLDNGRTWLPCGVEE